MILLLFISIASSCSLGMLDEKNFVANTVLLFVIFFVGRLSIPTTIVCCLFTVFAAIYAPTGLVYGKPDQSIIVSILETNKRESFEYLCSLSVWHLLLSVVLLVLTYCFFVTRYKAASVKVSAIVLIIFVALNLNSWPKRVLVKSANAVSDLKKELAHYKELTANKDDQWEILDNHAKKDVVIVIIGESLRKDYMSTFGYGLKTTPWLDEQNGYFFNHYISTAASTAKSLPSTLSLASQTDGKPKIQNNVVSLANKAGYNTYWLSNQGFVSKFDTIVSAISSYAKSTFFTKKGDYSAENQDDDVLLPKLKQVLAQDEAKKVIFVHVMGSHPNPCDRLFKYENIFKETFSDKKTACYVSTVSKTDDFIKNVVNLVPKGKNYSVIYFSDHGLSVDGDSSPHHCKDFKECYSVPLIVIDSDVKKRIVKEEQISAYNFLSIFSEVIGVKAKGINTFDFNAPQSTEARVFNGSNLVKYNDLGTQEVIYK